LPFHATDRRLLVSVQRGHVVGLAGLYDRHGSSCLSIANSLLASAQAAQDVVYEVFLDVWRTPAADRPGPMREHLTRRTVAACVASDEKRPERNLDGPTRV
jgi:DNA-directed RNA polymerase specialized sigma24 family protein